MITKTIKYCTFEGEPAEDVFYFSMNQTEFALLNAKLPGGLERYLESIRSTHDQSRLLELITTFVTESYGERTMNGGFVKKDPQGRKLGEQFLCTEAFDNLLSDLLSNDDAVTQFLIGVLPHSIQPQVRTEMSKLQKKVEEEGPGLHLVDGGEKANTPSNSNNGNPPQQRN